MNLDPRKRSNLIPPRSKDAAGNPLCRWCFKIVPKGRSAWCSEDCYQDAMIRTQPSFARAAVEARDNGVCAECGRDTRAIKNQLRNMGALMLDGLLAYDRTKKRAAARFGIPIGQLSEFLHNQSYIRRKPESELEHRVARIHNRLRTLSRARLKRLTAEYTAQGFDGIGLFGRVARSMWDADHIIPVVKGGGGCGLDNYRTLCQPCHKTETRKLAAERAAARRPTHPELPL